MLIRNYNFVICWKLGRIVGIDNHEMTRLECSYTVIRQYLYPERGTNSFLAEQCSGGQGDPTAQCV